MSNYSISDWIKCSPAATNTYPRLNSKFVPFKKLSISNCRLGFITKTGQIGCQIKFNSNRIYGSGEKSRLHLLAWTSSRVNSCTCKKVLHIVFYKVEFIRLV